ncbi:GxxExxY protein [Geomonas sp. Red69]|uniref:GxxExxY protein n=1 Tax=Geomonas diazotrophica TaxID=2843197 RepID=UPI001C10F61E|nr:GxxExxY protein [Geomonas diazotrophica]MBU5636055.1 GxxExxY protein [Geomonas diazotrophica]
MIYEDLTGKILAACFDVSNELGNGFLESVYERSLLIALEEAGLQARAQVPLQVFYRKKNVGDFYADVVVEGTVLLELKAVKALAPEHVAQVLNYLKATGIGVGLLINFGSPKLEYRRLGNRLCG